MQHGADHRSDQRGGDQGNQHGGDQEKEREVEEQQKANTIIASTNINNLKDYKLEGEASATVP